MAGVTSPAFVSPREVEIVPSVSTVGLLTADFTMPLARIGAASTDDDAVRSKSGITKRFIDIVIRVAWKRGKLKGQKVWEVGCF